MLGTRRDESRHPTAVVRDVVEVAAIVLAGLWALYVFVYEERIKPTALPAEITMTGSLTRLGERNGLVQFGYTVVIRNVGQRHVYMIATGFSANGERFAPNEKPTVQIGSEGSRTEFDRDAHLVSQSSVYRSVQLTRYANRRFHNSYQMDPGEEVPYSGTFLVRRSAYDQVTLYASAAYAVYAREFPVRVQNQGGAIVFNSVNGDRDLGTFQITLARASLW